MIRILRKRPAIFIAIAVLAVLFSACSLASEPIPAGPIETGPSGVAPIQPEPVVDREPSAISGSFIYFEKCVRCHGVAGDGQSEMAATINEQGIELPNFTDPAFVATRTPAEWHDIITNGKLDRIMPPFESLSEIERWDVTYYLYSLAFPPDALEIGESLFNDYFTDALGAEGADTGLDEDSLKDLSLQAITDEFLAGIDAPVTGEEQIYVAAYLQTLGYGEIISGHPGVSTGTETETGTDAGEETAGETPAEEPSEDDGLTAEAGLVRGAVTFMTPGSTMPAGLEVTLVGLTVDANEQTTEFLTQSTTVAEDGSFEFPGVPFNFDPAGYIIEVLYDGVLYSEGSLISADNPLLEMDIPVYEKTTDPSVIRVRSMHLLINEHPDAMTVQQIYVFDNTSDRVYVTDKQVSGGTFGSVAFTLPEVAYNLQFDDGQIGGRYIIQDDLIYDTQQVYPGEQSHFIMMTYFLPADGPLEFDLPIIYDTSQAAVLVQDTTKLKSDQLEATGTQDISGVNFNKYAAFSLSAGDTLTLKLSGTSPLSKNLLPIIFLGLAALLLAGGITLFIIQRRAGSDAAALIGGSQPAYAGKLGAIAALDDDLESGRITRFEYDVRRAELKAQLAEQLELDED